MLVLSAITLIALTIILIGLVVIQAVSGRVELVSARNVFLGGFILFQTVSGAWSLLADEFGDVGVSDPARAGMIFTLMSIVFLALFLATYHGSKLPSKVAVRIDPTYPAVTSSSLLVVSVILLAIAIVFRHVLVYVPVLGVLTSTLSGGLIAAAAAIAVWAWLPQFLNPAVLSLAIPVILVALFLSVFQNFGRRDLVGVLAACLFAGYYSYWRYKGVGYLARRLALVAPAAFFLIVVYTGARQNTSADITPSELVRILLEANVSSGVAQIINGQWAAANSMWLIETRPESFPFDPLHSLIFAITNPVPRILWEGKSLGLGMTMVDEAGIYFKAEDFNLGPGIIGHIWNDNPLLALPLYPVLLALGLRFLDDVVRIHRRNPYLVVPAGVVLGEILATPRGEVGLFVFRGVAGIAAAYLGLRFASKLLKTLGWSMTDSFRDEQAAATAYAEYSEQVEGAHDQSVHSDGRASSTSTGL